MRRASSLAGSGSCRIAVYAVPVAIILCPFVGAPLCGIGQFLLGILHFAALGAEFLPQLDGSCRAVFHASAAGHAVLGVDLGHIGAAGHIGGIEQLRGTQRIAYLDVAVADGEYLVLAVHVGYLVYESVVLSTL